MTGPAPELGPALHVEQEHASSQRFELRLGDEWVCRLRVLDLEVVGDDGELLRGAGVADVFTAEAHRNRSYAARLMQHAVEQMGADSGPALSLLYGIDRFYHRFGYAVCGDEHWLELVVRGSAGRAPEAGALPPGWTVRAFELADEAAVRACYEAVAMRTPGAGLRRRADHGVLRRLREQGPDDCRVVLRPDRSLAGYAWEGAGFDVRDSLAERHPHALTLAELHSDHRDETAASATLTMARQWALERGSTSVVTGLPPGHPVYEAARCEHARFTREVRPHGGMMALTLREPRAQPRGWYRYLPDRF